MLTFGYPESVKKAAGIAAYGMVSYYKGNESGQTPGKLPEPPYYVCNSGSFFSPHLALFGRLPKVAES